MKGWWLAESLSSAAPGWVYVSSYQKEWWKWCNRWCTCAGREKIRFAPVFFISNSKVSDYVRSTTILYQVRSTKYQVGDSGNWIFSTSSFKNQNSVFDIFNSVPRISYLVLFSLYWAHCTMYYFPNSILTELMQYRMPPWSLGPSGNRWPRCPPQEAQRISSRIIKWL